MTVRIAGILVLILFHVAGGTAQQQSEPAISREKIKGYEDQITHLIGFLEGTFNFIGNPDNPFKEKEIIFNDSYKKIFLSEKVQIEDDLDEQREYPIYKDVTAYLKDIGFFYRQAVFTFEITSVEHFINQDNQHFFLATLNRRLWGINLKNDTVDSKKTRYIEVNLNVTNEDFKIASIYTQKFNEREEVRKWWNDLTPEWKEYFGKDIFLADSLFLSDVHYFDDSLVVVSKNRPTEEKTSVLTEHALSPDENDLFDTIPFQTNLVQKQISAILKISEVNLSGNLSIRNLDPLGELSDLKYIDCSNTLVNNLIPLRNLNKLETLHCSGSPVQDISPLQYTSALKELNISRTLVSDLSSLVYLQRLERLFCSGNRLTGIGALEALPALKQLVCDSLEIYHLDEFRLLKTLDKLSIAGTYIADLSPLSELTQLRYLNCNNTLITSLVPLQKMISLEFLFINNTGVRYLYPLDSLPDLKRVYCNNTAITKADAIQFMQNKPGCLVIYESEELKKGWEKMDDTWKAIFSSKLGLEDLPTEEDLHGLLKLEDLDLSGRKEITDISPLNKLYNLKKLNLSDIGATSFAPLSELFKLEILDISNTAIASAEPLMLLSELRILNIENTSISTFRPLANMHPEIIYADNTGIDDDEAFSYRERKPGCLIVYKTQKLTNWWINLPESWREVLGVGIPTSETPTKEKLHQILFSEKVVVENRMDIHDLKPLIMLRGLKELILSGTQVSDISPLSSFSHLAILELNQCPIADGQPLSHLTNLTHLSIWNTPVNNLKPISALVNLQYLNFSGTGVSSLKPVQNLTGLRIVEFSNTRVSNINPLLKCPDLEKVVCFNTRVNAKRIAKFREQHPDCEVVYY